MVEVGPTLNLDYAFVLQRQGHFLQGSVHVPIRPDFSRLETWVGLLRQVAGPGEDQGSPAAAGTNPPSIRPFGPDDPAIGAWELAISGDCKAASLGLLELAGGGPDDSPGPRPFLAERDDLAIEVWTECELSVLHAVWKVLLKARFEDVGELPAVSRLETRVREAVAWHLDRTQPDNATTHPWAIHAFLELGKPAAEAIDYAGSILHAVEAAGYARGMVDPLSRWIMLDAAASLERGATDASHLGDASP